MSTPDTDAPEPLAPHPTEPSAPYPAEPSIPPIDVPGPTEPQRPL